MKKQVRAFIILLALILAMTAVLVSCGETNTLGETTAAGNDNTDVPAESTEVSQVDACKACGATIPNHAKFCPECGANLEEETMLATENTIVSETTKTPETTSVTETTNTPETTKAPETTSVTETTVTPHVHSWSSWTTISEATCNGDGTQERTCSCGEKEKQNISATGHKYGEWRVINPATCIKDGNQERICWCGDIDKGIISKFGHTEVIDPAIPSTCETQGKTEGTHCSVCLEVIVKQKTIPKIEHIESDWIIDKAATASEDGVRHTECTMCQKKMSEEILYATGSVGLAYEVNSDNESCTIVGIGTCTDSKVIIPAMIDGYKVTAIAKRAFYNCTSITEITIPETVTEIGTQIFYNASNLHTVNYNSPYSPKDNPFLNSIHITKVVFGGTKIPAKILQDCSNIKQVKIKDSVTSIGGYAFSNCSSLTEIIIPDSVNSIGGYAFSSCDSLTIVSLSASLTSLGDRSIFSDCTSLSSIVIPESVTKIPSYSFYGCTSLTSIVIPDSVTSIGEYVFRNCSQLESITIGNNVTSIGDETFLNCNNLTNVYITNISNWYKISFSSPSSHPLCHTGNLYVNGKLLTDLVIPDDITQIRKYQFIRCESLKSITIPDSVISIDWGAFEECANLTSITIPNSIVKIVSHAFSDCSALKDIYYTGTEAEWNAITIGDDNRYLQNAIIHFNSNK